MNRRTVFSTRYRSPTVEELLEHVSKTTQEDLLSFEHDIDLYMLIRMGYGMTDWFLTGRRRFRQGWFSRIILQVEEENS